MKICQLCAVDFTLKKFLLPLIDEMNHENFDVTSVCSSGDFTESILKEGYKVKIIPIARSLNPVKHIVSIWRLYRFFCKEKFDVLHVHTPVAALLGRAAAYFSRVPLVIYTAHGFYFHDGMPNWKKRIFVWLEKFAGRFTNLIFTQSSEDAETAVKEKFLSEEKVFAIGNGVNITVYNHALNDDQSRIRELLAIPENSFVVGMIGRLVEEKGIVEYLKAAMKLVDKKKDVYFLLVGARLDSDHAVAVDAVIDDAKAVLGERLLLLGLRDDIPEVIAAMDLFCLPSWREGMPRTIIEAMMMAKPVVATNIRGSREEIVHEETGLLVPVRSPLKLAEAILRCANHPEWSKKLGVSGRERALRLYDERKVVSLQIDLIKQFAEKAGLMAEKK